MQLRECFGSAYLVYWVRFEKIQLNPTSCYTQILNVILANEKLRMLNEQDKPSTRKPAVDGLTIF